MTWQSKSKQNKTKIWLPDISCIFLTQNYNFNQFRHGEVWWKMWTQSQDMITLLYCVKKVLVNNWPKLITYWVGIRGCQTWKKSSFTEPEIFLGFEIDLDFSRSWFSEIRVQIERLKNYSVVLKRSLPRRFFFYFQLFV